MARKDNRVFQFPRFERTAFESAGVDAPHQLAIQTRGDEPMIVYVSGGDVDFGYSMNGPWITFPSGTIADFELRHPFYGGSLWMRCTSAGDLDTVTATFMIGGSPIE